MLEKVESSNLDGVDYSEAEKRLVVHFKGGRRYAYKGVTPELMEEFRGAESKGRFFAQMIRRHFEGERLPDSD